MFAVQAQRCLSTLFHQTSTCLEVSKLCHTVNAINIRHNRVRTAVRKAKRKRSAIQKSEEENQEVVVPVDCHNGNAQMKTLNPTIKPNNHDAHDLNETEMKIVTDVIYDILSTKIINSHGKNVFLDKIRKTFNIPKSVPLNVDPVKPPESVICKENNCTEAPKPVPFSFPMFNTLTDLPREEIIVKLKSIIPKNFHLGENVVSSTHILESTRSHNLSSSQEVQLSMEDKQALENHLIVHLMAYIQAKTPPDFPDPDLPKHLLGYWTSMQKLARKITEVKGFDIQTTHPVLRYTATADIICSFDGHLVVMDWKNYIGLTNASLPASDYLLLAIACVGALNFDVNLSLEEPLRAVSVVCYPSGKAAQTLCMNSAIAQRNWKDWLQRLSKFYTEQN